MDISFSDKLGTEDRQILEVLIQNGELKLHMDKPETLGWQELIYFIKYVIAQSLSEVSEFSIGDIFQWLGSLGALSDDISKSAEDILIKARENRLKTLMQEEKLRLDRIDR